MKLSKIMMTTALLGALTNGCAAAEGCDEFAEHLADVVAKEKGSALDDELRAKMVKKTVDSCAADPPSKKVLECAKAAPSTEAMKACETGDDHEKEG